MARIRVRLRDGHNRLGVKLDEERRRELNRLLGRVVIVEGQADSDARAISIRRRPWGEPRAARVISAREIAIDEGNEGREDDEEDEGGGWQ